MEQAGVSRRLAAILNADVAGYSRLMGADEEATLATLGGHREVLDGLIAARRYPEAVQALKRIATPRLSHHAYLAACHAEMDALDEAHAHAAQILEMEPAFSARDHAETEPFAEPADQQHLRDALIKAGLPE